MPHPSTCVLSPLPSATGNLPIPWSEEACQKHIAIHPHVAPRPGTATAASRWGEAITSLPTQWLVFPDNPAAPTECPVPICLPTNTPSPGQNPPAAAGGGSAAPGQRPARAAACGTTVGRAPVPGTGTTPSAPPPPPPPPFATATAQRLRQCHIYTDGSFTDPRKGRRPGREPLPMPSPEGAAGWGMVLVSADQKANLGEYYGRVITHADDPLYLGAERGTNNTGELSAICQALRWALYAAESAELVRVGIHYDSQYAYSQIAGLVKARKNLRLVRYGRELLRRLRCRRCPEHRDGGTPSCRACRSCNAVQVHFEHVRAHRGHRWNEAADQAAGRGAAATAACAKLPLGCSAWPVHTDLTRSQEPGPPSPVPTPPDTPSSSCESTRASRRARRGGGWRTRQGCILSITWNANGLLTHASRGYPKWTALCETVQRLRPAFVTVTETKTSEYGPGLLHIPGYAIIRCDRSACDGGGLALWVREDLPFVHEATISTSEVEAIRVDVPRWDLRFIATYRPPHAGTSRETAEHIHSWLSGGPNRRVVTGDLNIDTRCPRASDPKRFTSALVDSGLSQRVRFVTRPSTGTTIDHLWTDCPRVACDPEYELDHRSDHRAVLTRAHFATGVPLQGTPPARTGRQWRRAEPVEFLDTLLAAGLASTAQEAQQPRPLGTLLHTWSRAWQRAKVLAPYGRARRRKQQCRRPWVTQATVIYMRRRRRLARRLHVLQQGEQRGLAPAAPQGRPPITAEVLRGRLERVDARWLAR